MEREIYIKEMYQVREIFKENFHMQQMMYIYEDHLEEKDEKDKDGVGLMATISSAMLGAILVPPSIFVFWGASNPLIAGGSALACACIIGTIAAFADKNSKKRNAMIDFFAKTKDLSVIRKVDKKRFEFFQKAYQALTESRTFIGETDFLPTSEAFENAIYPINSSRALGSSTFPEIESANTSKTSIEMIPVGNLQAIVDKISSENAKMEMDIVEILNNPVIFDMNFSATKKFMILMSQATTQKPSTKTVEPGGAFAKTVHELEFAWNFLKAESKRIKLANFSKEERQKVERAQKLISIALDATITPNERKIAYQRVVKELEGVLYVPIKAMFALESKTGLLSIQE